MGGNRRGLVLLVVISCLLFLFHMQPSFAATHIFPAPKHRHDSSQNSFNGLALSESGCHDAFPGLTKEIDNAVLEGEFELSFSEGARLHAKVEDNQLFILHEPGKGELSEAMHERQTASLHQIHRAITTSPTLLPNTSFTLSIHDVPSPGTLSFARRVTASSAQHVFPMPHFSFWSWSLPFIGSIPSAARAITTLESQLSYKDKDPRPVWRGTSWYNNGAGSHPRLRQDLIAATKDAKWADVQALDWETNSRDASNALRIEDFCRHRYIIHTEGSGYSGRLQFHQLCQSVVLSPPPEWMQHTSHLIKPVFSSNIVHASKEPKNNFPNSHEKAAWPVDNDVDEANMVFVNPDWSDLEDTVQWLDSHPEVAEGIARRQRALYAEKGYLSPAAEVCYWRALLNGWSKVAKPVGESWAAKGTPFEEYVVGKEKLQTQSRNR